MKYKIEQYINGDLKETTLIRASKYAHTEAYHKLRDARPDPIKYPDYEIKIWIDGNSISYEDAMAYVDSEYELFNKKREETHKQIWVRKKGYVTNCKNAFEQIWVKK